MEVRHEIGPDEIYRARLFYERPRKGPRPRFSFDHLYEKFRDPKLTFKDIADQLECSHSHIFFLFDFFRKIVPKSLRSPRKRKERIDRINREKQIKQLEQQDQNSAAALFKNLARQKKIRCERIYTSDGLMKRYVMVKGQLAYTAHNRKPRRARSQHFRRYFLFPLHKDIIGDAKTISLIAESEHRKDVYNFRAADLMGFEGMSKNLYIPDVTTPPLKKVVPNRDQLMFDEARNNWEIFKTAA